MAFVLPVASCKGSQTVILILFDPPGKLVFAETIITVIHRQAQAYPGNLEKLQHLQWYVAYTWADMLKE